MGIYDSGFVPKFGFNFDKGKIIPIVGAAVVIIILILVAFWVVSNYDSGPLSFRFEKNPVKPAEQTKVFVTVTNQGDLDAENVLLSLKAKEISDYDIYPLNENFEGEINYLSSRSSREVTFLINPIGEVLPGTYTLVAETTINGQLYEKEIKLFVEN